MNAANPARQVALVREAGSCGDLGKAKSPVSNQVDRPFQSKMNDILIWADANGSRKSAREVVLAEACHSGERRNVERLIEMLEDEIPETVEHALAQRPASLRLDPRRVRGCQGVDEAARDLVPKDGSARVPVFAFQDQHAGHIEKSLVVS